VKEPDRQPDRPTYIDRTTLAIASTILIVTSLLGLIFVPPGIIIGPVLDKFITPHLLRRRGYESPGPPLWAVALGAIGFLPALAVGAATTTSARDQALVVAVGVGFGAVLLGAVAMRGPLRRMGLIGVALGVGSVALAIVFHAQSS
jgi:hypothetical protein